LEIEFKEEKENPLLARRDITFTIKQEGGTPSLIEVKKQIAAKFNAPEELVIVSKIHQSFGKKASEGKASIYQDEDTLKKAVPAYLIKRNTPETTEEAEEGTEEKGSEEKSTEEKTSSGEAKTEEESEEAKTEPESEESE